MYDPISFWMQGTLTWIRVFKQQQEAYLRFLGSFAEKIPHKNSKELAREAEELKEIATSGAQDSKLPALRVSPTHPTKQSLPA